jgi:peptidoglycan/LPS O-acetylase OafA/YrhL
VSTTFPRPRFAGLDGLRAIAVALVVAYHLFPSVNLRSGFVGVDVFFVISGFLITSLLLREREAHGRIRLRRFWTRRARRLLPALALMVTVCATGAWVVGGDVLLDLGRQVLGAATFSYNWVSIGAGGDYFAAGQPELLRNLWSLAVEEQFYVVWPLVLPALLFLPARWARAGLALLAAAASAGWAASLLVSGSGLTRAYFGTDSHAFGLLIGVALAVILQPVFEHPREWMQRRSVRAAATVIGAAALVGLLAVATLPETDEPATFPGSLVAASVLSALVVGGAAWPASTLGRALDLAPLRVLGERSYAVYLWHWPVLVLLSAAVAGTATMDETPVWLGVLALLITIVASEFSFRALEVPVRRLGFRRVAQRAWASLARSARGRLRVIAGVTASLVLLGGTTAAIAAAPEVSSGEAIVDAGIRALQDQATPAPVASPTSTDGAAPAGTASGAPAPAAAGTASTPDPGAAPIGGDQITAIGDSVMLASAPALLERFPGIQIDAAVSRSMYAAPGLLRSLAEAGQLRPYVVVALGTNGAISPDTLAEVGDIVGPERHLVLVTAFAPRSWIDGVNGELTAYAHAHHRVQVADWASAIRGHVDLLAEDQVHPGQTGGQIFADTVAHALRNAQESEARAQEVVTALTLPREAAD